MFFPEINIAVGPASSLYVKLVMMCRIFRGYCYFRYKPNPNTVFYEINCILNILL